MLESQYLLLTQLWLWTSQQGRPCPRDSVKITVTSQEANETSYN